MAPGRSRNAVFTINEASYPVLICYGLRFSELFSEISDKVDCFINIAYCLNARIDHWRTLLEARAIEDQAYMVGVNRAGIDGNNLLHELSSSAYCPSVQSLHFDHLGGHPDFLVIDVNVSAVCAARSGFPSLKDTCATLDQSF